MMVACYTLDLYCDNENLVEVGVQWGMPRFEDANHTYDEGGQWQYTGKTFAECARKARQDGWIISKKRQLCPKCSGKEGR